MSRVLGLTDLSWWILLSPILILIAVIALFSLGGIAFIVLLNFITP